MTSDDVLAGLARDNACIEYFRFFSFSAATKLQDRLHLVDSATARIIEGARERKAATNTRFWNALLSMFIEGEAFEESLLAEALYHQPNKSLEDIRADRLKQFLAAEAVGNRAVNSKVLLRDGSSRHIPLLDFKIALQPGHEKLVQSCARALGLSGYILSSGRSYHFIGESLVSESELIDLLANFVLLDPLSDKAWAAHQLIERSASLRVSGKYGRKPEVICHTAKDL